MYALSAVALLQFCVRDSRGTYHQDDLFRRNNLPYFKTHTTTENIRRKTRRALGIDQQVSQMFVVGSVRFVVTRSLSDAQQR